MTFAVNALFMPMVERHLQFEVHVEASFMSRFVLMRDQFIEVIFAS